MSLKAIKALVNHLFYQYYVFYPLLDNKFPHQQITGKSIIFKCSQILSFTGKIRPTIMFFPLKS